MGIVGGGGTVGVNATGAFVLGVNDTCLYTEQVQGGHRANVRYGDLHENRRRSESAPCAVATKRTYAQGEKSGAVNTRLPGTRYLGDSPVRSHAL